jgi:hypothetical protein
MQMDHRIRQRLNEIRQKQLDTQQSTQEASPAPVSNNNSHYLFALLGMAAGFIISIIVWMMTPLSKTDDMTILMPESQVSIDANEISRANEQIDRLSGRLELLTQSINTLESRLNRLSDLSGSSTEAEVKPADTFQNHMAEAAGTGTTTGANELVASEDALSSNAGNPFTPTHSVLTNLNLRPSASLDSTPIAILSVGSKVEYMHESGDWYFVNTEGHGKGWCASWYLAPLKPPSTPSKTTDQEG